MTSDGELLRRYTESQSEDAFAELVRRHLDLVYSAALRQVNGDAHLAQDVSQSVFADLARKAGGLRDRSALAGWLYTSAHYGAANAVRTEQRRRNREQEAHAMQELLHEPGPDPDWESLRPVLDNAMQELSEEDREVIVLRYFENRPHADIGEHLGLRENTTRVRIQRALEKLRTILSRRGVTTTAAALSVVLSANAVQAAPVGLAVTISTSAAAVAGTTIASTATATAIKTIAMTTLQKTIIGATLVVAIGTGVYVATHPSHPRTEQGTQMRADIDTDIPLAQAIEQVNAEFPEAQPLTQEEVISAVRAIKLEYKNIPDSVYKTYQRVVKERVLPKGMYFTHTSGWHTEYGDFEVDWKDLTLDFDRAGIKEGKPGSIFNYRIRARFISLVGDETSATTQAPTRPRELHEPGYLGIRADIDKDIPLAQAIELANAKYGDAQPLTEAEVIASVRAIKLKFPDIPDSIYETYQRVAKERVLPKGMYFSHIPGWDTDYGSFKVDWKDLTLDSERDDAGVAKPGTAFNYRIRARFISSRPLNNMDKQAMRRTEELVKRMKSGQTAK